MYAFSDEERDKLLGKEAVSLEEVLVEEVDEENIEEEEGEEESKAKRSTKIHVQRYKGLGEMNSDELWETTMDPANRVLKQVSVVDAENANKIIDMLMGSEVPPRKTFIQSNAKLARLDV